MIKRKLFRKFMVGAFAAITVFGIFVADASAQRRRPVRHASVCGNPRVACKTTVEFQPYQLPFRISPNVVIWDTELFYAVILKSLKVTDDDCNIFVSETERQSAQELFPDNKVFASRCFEPGDLFYSGVNDNFRFMAVYAGRTLADANRMLASVKATGKYPGANIRRMRSGFNGT